MILRRSNRIPLTLAFVLVLTTVVCLFRTGVVFSQEEVEDARQYTVYGVYDKFQRAEIANTGAAIDAVGSDWVEISAIPSEATAIQGLGYRVEPIPFRAEAHEFQVYLPLIMASVQAEADVVPQYKVYGVSDRYQRTEIAGTGAAIDAVGSDWVEISAIPREISAIEALGYKVEPLPPPVKILEFPPRDSDYHDFEEMEVEITQAAADHSNVVSLFSLGLSYQERNLWAVKISDNPGVDEPEPEVLFNVHQHAREHLAVEQGLYILHMLTDEYATTPQITNLVNSREIYILFDVNPDGGVYDLLDSSYHNWRKNRQLNDDNSPIYTDLNRNWGHQWGCCGGSSGDPSSNTYRGPRPFSAPETDAVRSFVESRETGDGQQIAIAIDLHTYGQLILWPYGYTYEDVPPDMTVDDHDVLVTMGQNMASLSGYRAKQSADWYIVDGTFIDWMYGVHDVFSFVFELYPRAGHGGFYPSDEVIPAQTARNRDAILYLLELADCPYRAIGKESEYCSGGPVPPSPPTVNITAPADGATYASGATIDFAGAASDAEDGDVTASLDWTSNIDGQIGTGGSFSAVLSDGEHTITATATDSDDASGSDTVGITVGNPPSVHVGDLEGVSAPVRSKWEATVTITVHDQNHTPLVNATVAGTWSNGAKGGSECTTDGSGQCSVVKGNLKYSVASVTFTVEGVALTGYDFAPDANHDPDGDSDGTSIPVDQPQQSNRQ
jgi:hypothetical protein